MSLKLEKIISAVIHNKYYSNHGPLAQELEKSIETKLKVNCVTYASIELLTIAILDELPISVFKFYSATEKELIFKLIEFLRGPQAAKKFLNCSKTVGDIRTVNETTQNLKILYEVQTDNGAAVRVFDLLSYVDQHPVNGALAVSKDKNALEKIRWARSSYGRQASTTINIAANGRFSELQASALLDD